ncbi:hypothetical protein IKS57_04890 [bacterium]|nr:hypothetical protein [bacterium]
MPSSVTITADEEGQMPNVTLDYAGIQLINSNNTADFTVEGFEVTTRSYIENTVGTNYKIANQIEL